jgi:hypothetical protein
LYKLAATAAVIVIALLAVAYFVTASSNLVEVMRDFIMGIILNLIPVLFVFAVSYALFRRIQAIKSESETDDTVKKIVDALGKAQGQGLTSEPTKGDMLVQNADNKIVYLVDRLGLRRPISDDDTARYFAAMLGYQPDEIPQVASHLIRPIGPEVETRKRWRPPRTKDDDIWFEAQSSLKMLRRKIRTESKSKVLSFFIRNNGAYSIQIISAQLFLNPGAPLAESDISPENAPITRGSTTCKLLFDGGNEARKLNPQEESRLDLFLMRNLTADQSATIESVAFGYIDISAVYHDIPVSFLLYF